MQRTRTNKEGSDIKMDIRKFKWIRQPEQFEIGEDKITITTMPHTDLWQRTYYHFRNDNAPVLQMETEEADRRGILFLHRKDQFRGQPPAL